MSERPHIRRTDPERIEPVRNWSNLFRSAGAQRTAEAPANGTSAEAQAKEATSDGVAGAMASDVAAAVGEPVNEETRRTVENAYRVVDEHLQEGRRAARARVDGVQTAAPGATRTVPTGGAGMDIAAETIREIVAQGVRFYASLAPLWASVVNSIAVANSSNGSSANRPAAAPLAPAPTLRGTATMAAAPFIVELASTRMARVTVEIDPRANKARLATGGLLAIGSERPALKDVTVALDESGNLIVVGIRVRDEQPAGIYSGVIVDADSGDARGTITLRIEE